MKLDIVYEDEYLIACVKPYGVPSQPDTTYGVDMITMVKEYLYEKGESDGEPYVAIINRLDRPVGGIILFAKDEATAAKLSDMVQDGGIQKYYQVVVSGYLDEPEGEMVDWLLHDKKTNTAKVVSKDTKGAKKAVLNYEILDELDTDEGEISYLLVELITGRHHQIRCQMAAHGVPVWGDTKYNPAFQGGGKNGSKNGGKNGTSGKGGKGGKGGAGKDNSGKGKSGSKNVQIGLFSTRMEFVHPVTGEEIFLHREPEGDAFDIMDQMDW